jgi:putative transposase
MSNERRVHSKGTYAHYVTFSCFKRRKLLTPDICKRVVIGQMAARLKKQLAICCGFVVMPDHVHALVWFPEENKISQVMDQWKEITSKKIESVYQAEFPKYWSSVGANETVWQDRYYGFNVFTNKKLTEKLTYIHNNPVREGLVKDPCDWPWSSARWWLKGQPVRISLSWPP